MEHKYRALRIVGTFYKIFGAIIGIITIISILSFCVMSVAGGAAIRSMGNQLGFYSGGIVEGLIVGLVFTLFALLYGGGIAITLYALGEGISLLIAMEENTRMTSQLLQKQLEQPQTPQQLVD